MNQQISETEPGLRRAMDHLQSVLIPGESLEAWAVQRRVFALKHRRLLVAATSGRPAVTDGRSVPRPVPPECIVQPHLASAAATFGTWAGLGVLHAGAFVHEGRAWALLGDKTSSIVIS